MRNNYVGEAGKHPPSLACMGSASGKLKGSVMGEGLGPGQRQMGATDSSFGQSSQLCFSVLDIASNTDDDLHWVLTNILDVYSAID